MALSTLQRHLSIALHKVDSLCIAMAKVSSQTKLTEQDKFLLKKSRSVVQKWIQRKIRLQRRVDKATGVKNPTPLSRSAFNRTATFKRLNKTDPAAAIRYIMTENLA
jgi:hypothetical protein